MGQTVARTKPLFAGSIALLLVLVWKVPARAAEKPRSFAYVLQAESLAKQKPAAAEQLSKCGRDWIVLDAVFSTDTPWEKTDLERIRKGKDGRKVIAYISIGEAEDYRPYWRKEWAVKGKLTPAAPSWLVAQNKEWKGNFRVKYWRPGWQKIVLPAIDDVIERGFDGVYLDIVDGFETFEQEGKDFIEGRINAETKQSFRRDMVDWVKAIAAWARTQNPAAVVIPQNGSELLANEDFLTVISGIGIEDLFMEGDRPQSKSHTRDVLNNLKLLAAQQKPTLLIEYPKKPDLQARVKQLAEDNRMIWLITDRQLKTLGKSAE